MRDLDANLIVANAPDPVFVSNLEGKILLANEAVFELLGFRDARAHGRPRRGRRSRRHPQCPAQSAQRVRRSHPHHPQRSSLRGPAGEVIGVIGILRDMRELDKARAYAESLIKNAPDPVFVSDLQGKIL